MQDPAAGSPGPKHAAKPTPPALLSFAYAAILTLKFAPLERPGPGHGGNDVRVHCRPNLACLFVVRDGRSSTSGCRGRKLGRWRETQTALLGRMAFWITLAAGFCWLLRPGGRAPDMGGLDGHGGWARCRPLAWKRSGGWHVAGRCGHTAHRCRNSAGRPGRPRHGAGRGGIGCSRPRNLVGRPAFPPPSGGALSWLVCCQRPDPAPVQPFRPQSRLKGYRPHSFRSSSMVRSGPSSP